MDPLLEKEFDLRLQLPNHSLIIGMSRSGKTRLVLHLIQNLDRFHPSVKTILFLYDQYQPEYEQVKVALARQGVKMILREGSSITLDELERKETQTLLIIDDATEETASSTEIAKIATNGRHKNVSLWLIWHSLYTKHPASRMIAQNVSYFFFLPSVRLTSQIHTLDSQLRSKGQLVSAYEQAIDSNEEHKYLLLDVAPNTPSQFRYRTSVTQDPQHIFLP